MPHTSPRHHRRRARCSSRPRRQRPRPPPTGGSSTRDRPSAGSNAAAGGDESAPKPSRGSEGSTAPNQKEVTPEEGRANLDAFLRDLRFKESDDILKKISKVVSWILRRGAKSCGMRLQNPDGSPEEEIGTGYINVKELFPIILQVTEGELIPLQVLFSDDSMFPDGDGPEGVAMGPPNEDGESEIIWGEGTLEKYGHFNREGDVEGGAPKALSMNNFLAILKRSNEKKERYDFEVAGNLDPEHNTDGHLAEGDILVRAKYKVSGRAKEEKEKERRARKGAKGEKGGKGFYGDDWGKGGKGKGFDDWGYGGKGDGKWGGGFDKGGKGWGYDDGKGYGKKGGKGGKGGKGKGPQAHEGTPWRITPAKRWFLVVEDPDAFEKVIVRKGWSWIASRWASCSPTTRCLRRTKTS